MPLNLDGTAESADWLRVARERKRSGAAGREAPDGERKGARGRGAASLRVQPVTERTRFVRALLRGHG